MEPLGKEHMQSARMRLAERGTELTPEEFEDVTKRAFTKIRAALREKGFDVPEDDKEFFLWIKLMWL